jgi:hypothetical protein
MPTQKHYPQVAEEIARRQSNGLPIWDRLDCEPEKMFKQFAMYRDMGIDRSLTAMSRALGQPTISGALGDASQHYAWIMRAAEYDRFRIEHGPADSKLQRKVDRKLDKLAERIVQQQEEEYKVGHMMLSLIKSRLEEAMQPSSDKPLKIADADIPKFISAAVRLSRSGLGMAVPASNPNKLALPAQEEDLDLEEMSDNDIQMHLAKKRAAGA